MHTIVFFYCYCLRKLYFQFYLSLNYRARPFSSVLRLELNSANVYFAFSYLSFIALLYFKIGIELSVRSLLNTKCKVYLLSPNYSKLKYFYTCLIFHLVSLTSSMQLTLWDTSFERINLC